MYFNFLSFLINIADIYQLLNYHNHRLYEEIILYNNTIETDTIMILITFLKIIMHILMHDL